jgi:hypothetical protein
MCASCAGEWPCLASTEESRAYLESALRVRGYGCLVRPGMAVAELEDAVREIEADCLVSADELE